MKGWVIGLGLAALVTYTGMRVTTIIVGRTNLTNRLDRDLEMVDESSFDKVRQDVIKEAARLGIELQPADITIIYEDTEHLVYPQRVVSGFAQFKNKKVEIRARYRASVLGIGWPQEASASKIRQLQVKRASPGPEYDELLK